MATSDAFVFSRDYPIDRARMYALWTDRDALQQWFGPTGVTIPTSSLELRPGGRYHFCMRMPDGSELWGLWTFTAIEPGRRLQWHHGFSDADGGLTRHPMSADWPLVILSTVTFDDVADAPGTTRVTLHWTPHEATAGEAAVFAASFDSLRQGWTGTFDQLGQHLTSTSTAR